MYNFVRLATAVPRVFIGNVEKNTEEIIKKLKKASGKKADIVIFPELSVTGYTCGDLFFQSTLIEETKKAITKLASKAERTIAVVGAPICLDGGLYNCGVVLSKGKVLGIIPKTLIPNQNEFSEKRWFSSCTDLKTDKISSQELGISDNYEIPVGNDLVFSLGGQTSFGVEICKDLWGTISPGDVLSLGGAEIILNLSATNEVVGKRAFRREMVKSKSAFEICVYAFVSAGAEESTSDTVFSGHSLIAENGRIIAENSEIADNDYIMINDVDMEKIKSERIRNKTFSDVGNIYGKPCRKVFIPIDKVNGDGEIYKVCKNPFIPENKEDCKAVCREIFSIQSAGLERRIKATGGRPVVGVSGGLDSTLALLVSVRAVLKLGKSAKEVVGITMPCFGTTGRTYDNAIKLMKSLGVTVEEINIKEACLRHFEDIGHNKDVLDLTYENSQARERTQVLMDYAGKIGGFVVGTGDLSELALGWCTYNGDHMSMYGVNAGVPKTLIKKIIEYLAEGNTFPESGEILKDIVSTPISPELLPPDKRGEIRQKTEDIVGPYELHDFFLYYVVRFGFSPEKIYFLAQKAFAGEFDGETILKWLKNFYKRFFTQQFKRNCVPDGVKIGNAGLSPRGDLKMPSEASAEMWLKEIEKM